MRLSQTKFSIVLLGLLAVVASSCNLQPGDAVHLSVVDVGPFGAYVSKFEQKATELNSPVDITDLIIQFGPMTTPLEHGYCEMGGGKSPTIVIDETYWNQVEEGAKESLIFHEMGHCVLHRGHDSTLTSAGVPESLMYPYTIAANVFNANEAAYWQELFSKRNTL